MILISKINKHTCCGCGACSLVCVRECITMQFDEEGFIYPVTNPIDCSGCGLCDSVCPMRNGITQVTDTIYPEIFAATNSEPNILRESSSGGVFTAISAEIIRRRGIVYGAKYTDDFKVIHSSASTFDECGKFKTSKYVQSDLNDCFQKIKRQLKDNKKVLFSGTPCQVAGLNGFLHHSYENLYTCDIVCHGVPSPMLFAKYIKFIENVTKKKIASINMKNKREGWEHPSLCVTFKDGSSIYHTKESILWAQIFHSHLATRPSCHHCPFANFNRPGDLTIGDFWEIKESHPQMYNSYGVSLVILNTLKGSEIFESIKHELNYCMSSKEKCCQHNLYHPSEASNRRTEFCRDMQYRSFKYLAIHYLKYGLFGKIVNKLKASK